MGDSTIPFAQLAGQTLRGLSVCEPWCSTGNLDSFTPPLAGAIAFEFNTDVLVCWSPLRYMRHQGGTHLFDHDKERIIGLGFRAHICPTTEARYFRSFVNGPFDEPWELMPSRKWTAIAPHRFACFGQVLVRTSVVLGGCSPNALPRLQLTFDSGATLWLTYRVDLDGAIQLGDRGWDYARQVIAPTAPEHPFGWLLDDAPIPLLADGRRWRHVSEYAEGLSIRCDEWAGAVSQIERESLRRQYARRLKFRTFRSLERRVQALRYPIQDRQLDRLVQAIRSAMLG